MSIEAQYGKFLPDTEQFCALGNRRHVNTRAQNELDSKTYGLRSEKYEIIVSRRDDSTCTRINNIPMQKGTGADDEHRSSDRGSTTSKDDG